MQYAVLVLRENTSHFRYYAQIKSVFKKIKFYMLTYKGNLFDILL